MPLESFGHADVEGRGLPPEPSPAEYLSYALNAIRRRKGTVVAVFLGWLVLLVAFYAARTPLYRAETRVLAQRQQALPSIVRSSVPEDQPTRGAWELIHRRENLVELARSAGLIDPDAPPSATAKPASWLHRTIARITRASADEDPLEALVQLLDRRLKVDTSDVTISIELDWPDRRQGARIVDGALQNFLEARHLQEVSALDESIATLRGRAAALRDELGQVTEDTRRALLADAARSSRAIPGASTGTQAQATEELVRLKSMRDAKERAIADLEDIRRRRLAELQAQYESRRSVFAEAHPEMVNLRSDIAALSRESPQTAALRAEERQLREEYQARLARQPGSRSSAPATELVLRPAEGIDAAVERSERVRAARTQYQEVVAAVNRAQSELDSARSAFNLRYKVIWPVRVSNAPVSPNPVKILGIGGVVGLMLALLVPIALDLGSRKVLERWQVERGLDLPVLGEIRRAR